MKKGILFVSRSVLLFAFFGACNSDTSKSPDNNSISTDPAAIAKGEASFTKYCSDCHSFGRGGIGPQLGGITAAVPADWILNFIRNPAKLINSGDKRAQQLYKKYIVAMPSFSYLTENDVKDIIAFLHTRKQPDEFKSLGEDSAISNVIPDNIEVSDLTVDLELFTQMPASGYNGKVPFTRITKLDFEPTSRNTFVLDMQGKLYRMQNKQPVIYMDMAKLKPEFIHEPGLGTGFGSFAFHPDFAKNGLLYTTHAEGAGSRKPDFAYADSIKVAMQWVLTEWKTKNSASTEFSGTGRELLRINVPYVMHGIQEIAFNPLAKPGQKDYGMLYLGVGEGGCVQEGFPFLTHRKDRILGTIVRIDPGGNNSANGQYGIPQDNPFAESKDGEVLGEIYAYGFKNPHRMTWSKSGQMLVSNIGQSNIESVNLVEPGRDYGWPIREGTFVLNPFGDLTKVYPLPPNDSAYNITYPVAQYDHDGGWTAISGGFEYNGLDLPELTGKFIFGDVASGRLFYIEMVDIKQGKQAPIKEWKFSINNIQKTFKEMAGDAPRVDMHLGRDARGELYILIKPDGKVYKLVKASLK